MKKIFDIVCVGVTVFFVSLGFVAVSNFIAMDVQDAFGYAWGIVTFFVTFAVAIGAFMRWLILLKK